MKNLKLIESVNLSTYVQAVNEIVDGFFDEDGNYTPHIGRANAISVLFNYFVDEKCIDEYFPEDNIDSGVLLADKDCMIFYNDALIGNGVYLLDFSNAYSDALDIVNTRKTSLRYSFEIIEKALTSLLDRFSTTMNEENLAKLTSMVEKISQEGFGAESLKKAYEKSGRIEQIAG